MNPAEANEFRRTYVPFLLDLARCRVALDQWDDADAAVDACIRDFPRPWSYSIYSQSHLMKGFLLRRHGDEKGAREVWRRGTYQGFLDQLPAGERPPGQVPTGRRELLEHWMMGSLADALPDPAASALWVALAAQLSSDPLMTQMAGMFRISPVVIRGAWRSPRGQEVARRLAFLSIDPVEHIRLAPQVLVYEKLRQDLFDGRPTDDQDEVLWQCVTRAANRAFDGKLTKSQVLQVALAWNGTAGSLGWGGVARDLPVDVRGPLAYVMGLRYLNLNKPADAKGMFQTAAADAPADSTLRQFAREELRKLGGDP